MPNYLYRAGTIFIRYCMTDNQMEFLNLFYQKA